MNLYIRLLLVIIKCFFAPKIAVLDESRVEFHVLPTDCDINLHMTNSRYLSFMDLGRVYLMAQVRLMQPAFKQHWLPILSGCEVTFIRPLKPLQKFELGTRLLSWDEKYFYFEQCFEADNKIYARALARGTFLHEGNPVATSEILATLDASQLAAPKVELVDQWRAMIAIKKNN